MSRCALLIVFAALSAAAQTPASPHFDIVSVKPANGPGGFTGGLADGRITYAGTTLTTLINEAYNIGQGQLSGPDWLNAEWYAVSATFPPNTSRDDLRQMTANLLAERFGLVVHRITKEVQGFELVVAPGGPSPKMTASTAPTMAAPGAPVVAGPPERPGVDPEGYPVLNANQIMASRIQDGEERSTFAHRTMHAFANDLQRDLTQLSADGALIPIADKTGLTGFFDFHLAIPAGPRRLPPALRLRTGQTMTADDTPPVGPKEVSAALEKQLGLKLNPVKTSLDYIVVDKVNKVPTEN